MVPQKIVATFHNRTIDKSSPMLLYKNFSGIFMYDLLNILRKNNIRLVHILNQESYIGGGVFSGYWELDNDQAPSTMILYRDKIIAPDLVFDKGHITFNDGFLNVFNSPELAQLGRNKYSQYRLFADLQPRSIIVHNSGAKAKISELSTDHVVIKPLNLNGGRGITITRKSELPDIIPPVIAQEFIESKDGIPHITNTYHDLRLYIINDNIVLASVRTPQPGGLLSNVHQGGTIEMLDFHRLPRELIYIFSKVNERLTQYRDRFYAADFMFDGSRWWLIEINDRPGMPSLQQETADGAVSAFYNRFVTFIINLLSER